MGLFDVYNSSALAISMSIEPRDSSIDSILFKIASVSKPTSMDLFVSRNFFNFDFLSSTTLPIDFTFSSIKSIAFLDFSVSTFILWLRKILFA